MKTSDTIYEYLPKVENSRCPLHMQAWQESSAGLASFMGSFTVAFLVCGSTGAIDDYTCYLLFIRLWSRCLKCSSRCHGVSSKPRRPKDGLDHAKLDLLLQVPECVLVLGAAR